MQRTLNQNDGSLTMFASGQRAPSNFTTFQERLRNFLRRKFAFRQMKSFVPILLGCFTFKLSDVYKTAKYKTMINLHINGKLNTLSSVCMGNIPHEVTTMVFIVC